MNKIIDINKLLYVIYIFCFSNFVFDEIQISIILKKGFTYGSL